MTTIPTTVVILDVFKLIAPVSCKGPHQKGEDWPPRSTEYAIVGYFVVPLYKKPDGLKIHFEIPLCDECRSKAVD
jgi:hypothetical protein